MSKKFASLCLVLILSVVLVSASASVTLTDMAGREVTIEKPVTRMVVLTAADCEILYAIGAEDLIVGRGEYCDYPEAVLDIPSVESGYETNIEQILALEPQVVVLGMMNQTVEQNTALENAGIATVVTNAQTIEDIYEEILLAGVLTGRGEAAEALVNNMKEELSAYTAEPSGKRVYFEVSPLEWGLWTAGSGNFMTELAGMCGAENIFSELEGWAEISEEQVIARDPQYIVTLTPYVGEITGDAEILSRPAWQSVSAVKDGKIAVFDSNIISRPGPRIVEAARAMNAFINAE